MATNNTFTILKPDAVKNGHIGAILAMINAAGFKISGMKMLQLSQSEVNSFYSIHKERPWFHELVDYMTSGPIVVAVLEKTNAVEEFRKLIGATDPSKAAEGTIRKKFAKSIGENAIHGSDSDENAAMEGSFFFANSERF
jgi:nucleoside-diphosphate kinase